MLGGILTALAVLFVLFYVLPSLPESVPRVVLPTLGSTAVAVVIGAIVAYLIARHLRGA